MSPVFLTCPKLYSLPGIRHGFFTRQGGVSQGIFSSLNCGVGSTDDPDAVAQNRQAVVQALEGAVLCTAHQVHSAEVAVVTEPFGKKRPEVDALITQTPGIVLGVLTADCGPVLFADPVAKIIGTAHAGWKGALHGVVENTVAAMERLGSQRQDIVVTLGPTIAQTSYEVDQGFYDQFLTQHSDFGAFFQTGKAGHYQFDLPGFIVSKIERLGVASVHNLALDTYADEERFFSWRRTFHQGGTDYGRLVSALVL